jgi:phosphatidylinositol glycan class T
MRDRLFKNFCGADPGSGSDWSLRSLFDRSIPRSCNIATSSVVRIQLPSASEGGLYTLSPQPWVSTDDDVAFYDLTNGKDILSLMDREKLTHSRLEVPLSLISL